MERTRASRGPALPGSSSPAAQPLPFAGELLGAVASALRLGDVRTGSEALSSSAVKRLAGGKPHVAVSKRAAMLREIVATLFKPAYLSARGLSPSEIATHNHRLITALEEVAERWDALAGQLNHHDLRFAAGLVVHAIGKPVFLDAEVRCAAYLCLYAREHRLLGLVEGWARKSGVKGCVDGLCRRSRRAWTTQAIHQRAGITKNTWQAIKAGRALPQEDTLERLAHAIATFDVRIGVDEIETPQEIELELRVACAVAEVAAWAERHGDAAATFDFHLGTVLRFFRYDLRRYGPTELAEILARGTASPRWPEIEARLGGAIASTAVDMGQQLVTYEEVRTESFTALLKTDPKAALHQFADDLAKSAERTRAAVARVPGWERSTAGDVVQFFETSGELFRCLAEDREPPTSGRILGEEFKAKSLCEHALAPWIDATREQREALLLEAVETYPGSSEVRARYGGFLAADQERFEDAMIQIRLAVILDEDNDQARYALASMLASRHELDEALGHLDELEKRGRSTASSATLRGNCLAKMGRWVDAEMAFEQALKHQPRLVPALQGRAHCRRAAGDEAGARRLLREAEFYESGKPATAR